MDSGKMVSPPDVAVVLRKCQMGEPASQKALRQSGSNSFRLVHTRGGSLLASPQKLCKNVLNGPCYLFAFFVPVFLLGSKGFEVSKNNGRKSKNSQVFHVDSSKRSRSEVGNWWKLPCSASSTFINLFNLALQCFGNASDNQPRLVPNYESTWPASHNSVPP